MPQNTNTNEVRATAKYVRVAPRKARAVVSLIRDLPVEKALEVLQFSTRAAAVDVAKVLRSAVANAENNFSMDTSKLYVSEVYATSGPILKRMIPASKGRGYRINKRTSHVTLAVAEKN